MTRLMAVAALALATALVALATSRGQGQHAVWSGPYYSGAANFSPAEPFRWIVCPADLSNYRDLSREEQRDYRFSSCTDGIHYKYNSIGFLWVVYAAKLALPWLPDQRAVVAFQLAAHIATVIVVLLLIGDNVRRAVFILLYAVNPLVLYFVQFPYEYFWPSLASLFFIIALLRNQWSLLFLVCFVMGGVLLFHIRPTVAPLLLLTLLLLFLLNRTPRYAVACVALFLLMVGTSYQQKGIWHTAYVGIGAYPNKFVHGLSDNNGYDLFERKKKVSLEISSPNGNYYDSTVYSEYQDTLKTEFLAIARHQPMMLIRNATLNGLQAYSFGFPVGHPTLAYLSAAFGAVMLAALVFTRQHAILFGIGAVSAGFAAYFPPIPAYMFGAYLLLAVAASDLAERAVGHRFRARWRRRAA